jgi:hypothetical protein
LCRALARLRMSATKVLSIEKEASHSRNSGGSTHPEAHEVGSLLRRKLVMPSGCERGHRRTL